MAKMVLVLGYGLQLVQKSQQAVMEPIGLLFLPVRLVDFQQALQHVVLHMEKII